MHATTATATSTTMSPRAFKAAQKLKRKENARPASAHARLFTLPLPLELELRLKLKLTEAVAVAVAVGVACGQDKFRVHRRRKRRVTEIKSAALKCSAENFGSASVREPESSESESLENLLSVAGLTWKKSMTAPTHHERRERVEPDPAKPLREILLRIFICS